MAAQSRTQSVSVIGLGNMGSALAEALIANGHRVTVWNRTASKGEPLSAAGATVAASASEAAAAGQTVVVCVTDHDASASLLLTDEVAKALRGKLLVQFSTVTAEQSRTLDHWAAENGVEYLDGSILAYPSNIRSNEGGTILYSGPRALFEANAVVLGDMNATPEFVGETVGSAAIFDKTIYAYHYAHMLAFFHGAAMCHAAGLPVDTYVRQVAEHGVSSKRRFGEMIAKRSYDNPSCAMEVEAQAYSHVVKLSEKLGVDSRFPKTVMGYFKQAIADGHGQHDLASTFEVLLKPST